MTPPLDDGLEKLQAFVHLLESTNSALGKGATDLERVDQALGASESRLRTDLQGLDAEVHGLQTEVESSAGSVVSACHELAAAAEAVRADLPDIESAAKESRDEWVRDLGEASGGLEAAFQKIESEGFSPLSEVLLAERASFERWTGEADAALEGLGHETDGASQVIARISADWHSLTDGYAEAPMFTSPFWQPAEAEADKVSAETVDSVRDQALVLAQGLGHASTELLPAVQHDAAEAQTAAGARAESLAAAIQEDVQEVVQAVDTAEAALSEAGIEFDATAIAAGDAAPRAGELTPLAARIAAADVEIEEIRAAMEAI